MNKWVLKEIKVRDTLTHRHTQVNKLNTLLFQLSTVFLLDLISPHRVRRLYMHHSVDVRRRLWRAWSSSLSFHTILPQMSHAHGETSPEVLTQVQKVLYEKFRSVPCTDFKISGDHERVTASVFIWRAHCWLHSIFLSLWSIVQMRPNI